MIKAKKRATAAHPIDPEKLKAYVERIENVETRITEERDARADIYTEVKASGLKPKLVRKIVRERAKKEEDAAELAELERYREALAMPGATYRSVAEKTGIPRSTLHRLVPRAKNGTEPPHNPETGEITETADLDTRPGSETGTACGPSPAPLAADNAERVAITSSSLTSQHDRQTSNMVEDDLAFPPHLNRRIQVPA